MADSGFGDFMSCKYHFGCNRRIRQYFGYLQAVATAVAVCVVAILAWRYVSHKPTIWKVLYFVVLLVVIAGIIVPAVL